MDKLKGVGGWLLFFIITLVFIGPIYQLLDFFLYPQFYFYGEVLAPSSVVYAILISGWMIFAGVSLWAKNKKAVIWAKEFLIAMLVLSIFSSIYSYGFFSSEDYSLILYDVFRGIVYFAIWFSYLNVSKRVKNTFKDRKLNLGRVVAVSAIAIAALFVLTIIFSFIPLKIGENTSLEQGGITYTDTLFPEYVQYYEFGSPEISSTVRAVFEGSNILEIYFVRSEQDYNNFLEDKDFEIYEGCLSKYSSSGEIECFVSTGGLIVYNPNLETVTYSIRMYG